MSLLPTWLSPATRRSVCVAHVLVLWLGLQHKAWAKKQYFSAEKYESERVDGQDVVKCTGNFVFKKDDITIYADIAYWNEKKKQIDIRDNVRILRREKGSSEVKHTITAKQLLYHRKKKTAHLSGDVVLVEGDKQLTSDEGFYDEKHEHGWFRGKVHFSSDEEDLTCWQLFYNQLRKETRKKHKDLFGKTHPKEVYVARGRVVAYLKEQNVTLYGAEGLFDKEQDQAKVCGKGTMLQKNLGEEPLYLLADSFLLLKDTGEYDEEIKEEEKDAEKEKQDEEEEKDKDKQTTEDKADGENTEQQKKATTSQKKGEQEEGAADEAEKEEGQEDKGQGEEEEEEEDKKKKHLLHAEGKVRLYNKELQGQAGKLRYHPKTTTVYLEDGPVLWGQDSQFSAETAVISFKDDDIDNIALKPHARILQLDKQRNHNQIRGKDMHLKFDEGKLVGIEVTGDPESIYFLLEEDEDDEEEETATAKEEGEQPESATAQAETAEGAEGVKATPPPTTAAAEATAKGAVDTKKEKAAAETGEEEAAAPKKRKKDPPTLAGMNHAWCEKIHIVIDGSEATEIHLTGKTKGMIHPPSAIDATNSTLGGFSWQGEERLTTAEINELLKSYNKAPIPEGEEEEKEKKEEEAAVATSSDRRKENKEDKS